MCTNWTGSDNCWEATMYTHLDFNNGKGYDTEWERKFRQTEMLKKTSRRRCLGPLHGICFLFGTWTTKIYTSYFVLEKPI